jgi:lipopolysaccharide biosynthesis glycosyltransferase
MDVLPIVLASDENYIPYAAAVVKSIINNRDPKRSYDIIILELGISERSKELFMELAEVRFINVKKLIEGYRLNAKHLTVETYLRLLMPEVLPEYNKAIYLDCDIIVKDDISKLYDIDAGNACFAGVRCFGLISCMCAYHPLREYFLDKLKMKEENLFRYINAGVLIMNLERIREKHSACAMMSYAQEKDFRYNDQDIINSLFQDDICILPDEWNVTAKGGIVRDAPPEIYAEYMLSRENPALIHYGSYEKPWESPGMDYADEFWAVFKQTPFHNQEQEIKP